MANFEAAEIVKLLVNVIIGLGGGYVVLLVKGISKDIVNVSKDIGQLKEFFMLQIKTLENDIVQHRKDLQELYDLARATGERVVKVEADLKALRDEHNRACALKRGGK